MTDLTFKIDLPYRLFDPVAEEKLSQSLHPFESQMDGQVVAVQMDYSFCKGDLLRHPGATFWLRNGNCISASRYDALPACKQAGLAEAVVRLDQDFHFAIHVNDSILRMKTKPDRDRYHVVVTADAIAVLKPGPTNDYCEWSANQLDRFCRFHCRRAESQHDALARHDDLKKLIHLWGCILHHYNLPPLSAPTVGDLLRARHEE